MSFLNLNFLKLKKSRNIERKTLWYVEYTDLPKKMIECTEDPWNHMQIGALKLEDFNNKFITKKNIKSIKSILKKYFFTDQLISTKSEYIIIYISEYIRVDIYFDLFKIKVRVDYD